MEHKEQILFRKLLKKNGFKKSSTKDNPELMEFTKGDMGTDDYLIVYTYKEVEFYAGSEFSGNIIPNIEKFKELYKKYTLKEFLT